MTPLTRESVEISNPGNESVVAHAASPAKPASGRARVDAVSLEIPVKVHGSRVTEMAHGATPRTEPFEEQTSTMIVFPQGGVLRMSTVLAVGQMVVLTNLKSRQDAICRVLKVRAFSNMPGYIEIEFTHPQPGYWGVHFPSEGSAPANKAATPAPIAPAPPESLPVPEKHIPAVSWASAPAFIAPAEKPLDAHTSAEEAKPVVPPPAPFTPPSKPESSFVSIGSQEKVQAVASSTPERNTILPVEHETKRGPFETTKRGVVIDFPPAPPAAPLPSLSMAELRGDEEPASAGPSDEIFMPEMKQEASGTPVEAVPSAEVSHATFGTLSDGASLSSTPAAPTDAFAFGTRLGAGLAVSAKKSEKPRGNWLWAAACVVGFVAVAGGGAYYYTQLVASPRTAAPVRALATNPAPAQYATPAQPVPASGIAATVSSAPVASAKKPDATPAKPEAAVKQLSSRVTPGMMAATLNAHPISSQRANAGDSNSAPSTDAGEVPASENAAMPGIISSSANLMPPRPEEPVRVGGQVKPGRLISSVMPVYPAAARATHIEGDVLIKTSIDQTGKVVNMQVVSGPQALRQAALDALRQWKYEPSTLNGQPTSVQLEVTIRFHL